LDDFKKTVEQRRHFGVERRLAFGKRAVQIKNDKRFHRWRT
jgi:hypothetical protein